MLQIRSGVNALARPAVRKNNAAPKPVSRSYRTSKSLRNTGSNAKTAAKAAAGTS
jgi:hypothetical protein